MKAIRFEQHGGYDELRVTEVPATEPTDTEVLVKMTAAAVNPLDDTVRLGGFPMAAEPPLVPGIEGVGVVERPGASGLAEGTRVMFCGTYGVTRDGTWREYVAAGSREVVPVPEGLTDAEAAAVPVAYLTAQLALKAGGFSSGQSMLVPGIGGSVGNAVVQLARAQGASRVISSTSSTRKAEKARECGFADVLDLSREPLSEGVMRLTKGAGVELAVDSVGGSLVGQALTTLGQGGALVTLGYTAGAKATVNLLDLIAKEARIFGFSLYSQSPEACREAYEIITKLLDEGEITPPVSRNFPLEEAAAAQRYLIEERPFGKVVLSV